ncbi:MAG: M23 family metallopeptidase [Clostridiales bacterium]|jgi:murein DD-endopeptidase MepM/ murein hydrolase activator NlpD|nr:M23 family metallopeptidase [Clostridiales bacterium]
MIDKTPRWDIVRQNAVVFVKKHGFAVVIGLCALCVGIAAAVKFLPGKNEAPPETDGRQVNLSRDEQLGGVSPAATPLPPNTQALAQLSIPTPSPSPSPAQKPAQANTKYAPPVEGKVIGGYAMRELLYSVTLDQWTTHDGIDIACQLGTKVKAFLAGTVRRVYTDGLYGVTVEIDHDGGLVSIYANLAAGPPAVEGQKVQAGAVIGVIGDTAINECAMAPHLHFAIYKNDAAVNPSQYLLLDP